MQVKLPCSYSFSTYEVPVRVVARLRKKGVITVHLSHQENAMVVRTPKYCLSRHTRRIASTSRARHPFHPGGSR
jgi:hypothetical protein